MEKPVTSTSVILLSVTVTFVALFGFVGVYFEMPYHKWLVSNLPEWFAIVNVSVLWLSFIIMIIIRRWWRLYLYHIAMIGTIFSLPTLVASLEVEQFITRIIFFSSLIVGAILEGFTRRKKSKTKIKNDIK